MTRCPKCGAPEGESCRHSYPCVEPLDERSMFEAGEHPTSLQRGYDAGYALREAFYTDADNAPRWAMGYALGLSHRAADDRRAAEQVSS